MDRDEYEFDSGITESDLMDRLKEALDRGDILAEKLDAMERSWKKVCAIAHESESRGTDIGYPELLTAFNEMRMDFLKIEGKL